MKKRIALIGYMSSGKTTMAHLLSSHYRIPYIDLDEEITKRTGKSLEILFKESEFRFREMELEELKRAEQQDHFILSLGGGTPQIEGALPILKNFTIIYLEVPLEVAYKRSKDKPYKRIESEFYKLNASRTYLFETISDYKVITNKEIEACLAELIKLIDDNQLL